MMREGAGEASHSGRRDEENGEEEPQQVLRETAEAGSGRQRLKFTSPESRISEAS